MSRLHTAIHNDIQALELLRDELGLQAHLFTAESKARWHELEGTWSALKAHVERARTAGGAASRDAGAAASLMADSLREGYAKIRDAFES